MKFGLVFTMTVLLLLGGVALAGGDGDRCGGGCGGKAVLEKPAADGCGGDCGESCGGACGDEAGATGEEGSEGEGGDAVKEAKEEHRVRVQLKGVPDGPKKQVRVQLGGDWESLPPEAKKQILDSLRGTVDEATLKQILESLVKGEREIEIESEGPVRVFATPRLGLGRALKKACPDCAGKDGSCEKCRKATEGCGDCEKGECDGSCGGKAFRLFLEDGERPGRFEIEGLPTRGMLKVLRMGGSDGNCPMCGGHAGPQAPRMRMGRGGGPRMGMGPGPRMGGGMGMRGRGQPGVGMPDGMGRELLEALNGLRDEIRALRHDMRAGHGAPPVPGRMATGGGAGGMVILPGGKPAEPPAAMRAGTGAAGTVFVVPAHKADHGLQKEVDQLKQELQALKARMSSLLDHLQKAEAEKK